MLLTGPRPVLVDPGFGADVPALKIWLQAQGTPLDTVALVVNTHFDCDHAGANHALIGYGLPIAAGAAEAAMVNARHPDSCRARWLHQPIEPYRVARPLHDGDQVGTGSWSWQVLDTPGHTAGHISLYCAEAEILVAGDVVHSDDLGWIDLHRPGAIDEADATIAKLAALPVRVAYSGHGKPTLDPGAALATARLRLRGWRTAPERMAWHAVKRVFAYGLMVEDGVSADGVLPYLLGCPWFHDYAAIPFGVTPDQFAGMLLDAMIQSGAARWQGDRLVAGAPFVPPRRGWAVAPTEPALWPR